MISYALTGGWENVKSLYSTFSLFFSVSLSPLSEPLDYVWERDDKPFKEITRALSLFHPFAFLMHTHMDTQTLPHTHKIKSINLSNATVPDGI